MGSIVYKQMLLSCDGQGVSSGNARRRRGEKASADAFYRILRFFLRLPPDKYSISSSCSLVERASESICSQRE